VGFCVHNTAANRGSTQPALSKAWRFSCFFI